MIFELDRNKAISAISEVISEQNNDVLQEIYHRIELSKILTQSHVLKIWNKITPLGSLSDSEIDELLRVCLSVCKIGCYGDFLIEVDTSPVKKRYLDTVSNPKTKAVCIQYLELFTEKIESVFHKDLCKLTYDEAISGLSRLPNLAATPLRQALTVARGYCKFCQDNNEFDGKAINNFKNIKPDDIPIDPWVKEYVVKDSVDLVSRIEKAMPINCGFMAPIVSSLAWMQFSVEECLELKRADVSLYDRTICGRKIPDRMVEIITSYLNYTDDDLDNGTQLLKKTWRKLKGKKCSKYDIANSLRAVDKMSFSNIRTSSLLYDLYLHEVEFGELSKEDFTITFRLDPKTTAYWTYLKDKQRLYNAYKRVYWDS